MAEMMEQPGAEAPAEAPMGAPEAPQANPVVGAIETIAKFVAAQAEKQSEKAPAMQAWLQQGIELFAGGEEAPKPEEAGPMSGNGDVNAGAGSVPVL